MRKWLSSFLKFSRSHHKSQIPSIIALEERLARAIFSPINLNANGTVKPNAFRTPSGKDEVSVNRLNYTTPSFCKNIAKKNQLPPDRNYQGFAILLQKEVMDSDCSTVYSPIVNPPKDRNPYHADIKVGFVPKKGEELPGHISKKIRDLTKKARFYKDPYIYQDNWEGGDLT